jgi:hypothetical protein
MSGFGFGGCGCVVGEKGEAVSVGFSEAEEGDVVG